MDKFQAMEEKLHQLMPRALSDDAQANLENQIDELAGVVNAHPSSVKGINSSMVMKVAAILVLVTTTFVVIKSSDSRDVAHEVISDRRSSLVVINSISRLEGVIDDGLIYPNDGATPHFRYRYEVSNEEKVRDEYTGTIITVRQPSYEVVTIPQTIF